MISPVNTDVTRTESLFDDAFLRQLERLRLLVNSPARGAGGGERSVSRVGTGLKFHDHRPVSYTHLTLPTKA